MGKVIVAQFVTLDGVIEDPDGSGGTPYGGWAFRTTPRRWRGTSSGSARCSTPASSCSAARPGSCSPGSSRRRTDDFSRKLTAMEKLVASRSLDRVDAWAQLHPPARRPRGGGAAPPRDARTWSSPAAAASSTRSSPTTSSTSTGSWCSRPCSARAASSSTRRAHPSTSGSSRPRTPAAACSARSTIGTRGGAAVRYALLINERPGAYVASTAASGPRSPRSTSRCATTTGCSTARGSRPPRPPPRCARSTASCCSPTARSPRPRRCSAASTSSRPPTWTPRSRIAARIPALRMGGSVEVRPVARRWRPVLDEVFRAEWGRVVAALVGLLRRRRRRRGRRAGGVRDRRAPLAGRRNAGQPAGVAGGDRPQPGRSTGSAATAPSPRSSASSRRPAEVPVTDVVPDERLELVFLCCHPALAPEARVALTLRALGGLSTPEIARAFLVAEETMKRRLTRARTKIREAGIPFRVPDADGAARPARRRPRRALPDLQPGLRRRPGRPRRRGHPPHPHPRRAAARPPSGCSRCWPSCCCTTPAATRASPTASSCRSPSRTAPRGTATGSPKAARCSTARSPRAPAAPTPCRPRSPSCRPRTRSTGRRSWRSTTRLLAQTGSAVVALNRAVAVAEAEGPGPALALVDALDLDGYRYFHSTRAELLRRVGDTAGRPRRLRPRPRAHHHRRRAPLPRPAAARRAGIALRRRVRGVHDDAHRHRRGHDQRRARRLRAAGPAAARLPADPRDVAPGRARRWREEHTVVAPDLRGYGDSSRPPAGDDHARLRVPGDGRRPGRGDARAGPRALRRGRARPGRARRAPDDARPPRRRHPARRARHRADAARLRARRPGPGHGLLPLVLLHPARPAARSG